MAYVVFRLTVGKAPLNFIRGFSVINHDLSGIVLSKASAVVCKQENSGTLPAGHNGPYRDTETPVRNTAYWLYTFSWLVSKGAEEFRIPANRAADYLISEDARPMGAAFFCRKNPDKDFSNGLIGQAWVAESLLFAAGVLERNELVDLVIEVLAKHKFSEQLGGWHVLNVDGSNGSFCATFNQQLWFAAMSAKIGKGTELEERALRFFSRNITSVELYQDGVILHHSEMRRLVRGDRITKRDLVRSLLWLAQRRGRMSVERTRSVGYHSFNLVAFSYLKQCWPEHQFWRSKKFSRIAMAVQSQSFLRNLDESVYAWAYNPSGFEIAFFGEVFGLGPNYCRDWVEKQVLRTYRQADYKGFEVKAPDLETFSARIYEAARLTGNYQLETGG
jgi:hypothetical protein